MAIEPPKEISREAAGDTRPVDPGETGADPSDADLNGGGGSDRSDGDSRSSDTNGDGKPPLDPKDFVSKEEYNKAVKQRDHNYARLKKAEKKLKEKGITLEDDDSEPSAQSPDSPADPFSLAKQVGVLKDFDEREIDFAAFIAKGKGITASEAIKTIEFETFLKGKRGADFKSSNVPAPGSGGRPENYLPDPKKIGTMSKEDHAALDKKAMDRQTGGGGI